MRKLIVISAMFFSCALGYSQTMIQSTDSIYCELYLCMNDPDAVNYSFDLYLNDQKIMDIQSGTRIIYRVSSQCQITISDNKHKPYASINAIPGSKYYFRIRKNFGSKYFQLKEYRTESEVQEYLHFYFWERYIHTGKAGKWEDGLFSQAADGGQTVELYESSISPICSDE